MGKLHRSLLENNGLYYRWHQRKFHQLVHWVAFVSVSIFITLMMVVSISGLVPDKSVANASQSFTCDFYASPAGTSAGTGSLASPWDLQTALNKTAQISAGKTLCLKEGTYIGKYSSDLNGSSLNPATVRSAPGEWAKIDGYLTSTLRTALPASAGDPVTVVLNTDPGFSAGPIRIGNEDIYISGKQSDGVTWTNSARGWNGTTPTAHSVGSVAIGIGDQLTINGQYTNYRDFEVFNSDPVRSFNSIVIPQDYRGEGVIVNPSTGIKLINLVIHDNREGIFAGVGALGLEIYGAVIFNNGLVDWDRGHGQGIYALNGPGSPQKKIRNVISFNGFSDGMKAYSESQYAQNFLFEHIISFNNGVLASFPGNHGDNGAQLAANERYSNIFVGTGNSNNPTNDILIHDSYLYDPFDSKPSGGNLGLGYQAPNATGLEILNSRIMGGNSALSLSHFLTYTVTGNKFYAQATTAGSSWNTLVSAQLESGNSGTWNNNTYFSQLPIAWQFQYTRGVALVHACDTGGILKYTETGCSPNGGWKEHTGFDANSSFVIAVPAGTEVFIVPNEYEEGRANIAVYNWGHASSLNIDLSQAGVQSGQSYEIRKAENYFGTPVSSGTYSGGTVSVPMNDTTVTAPIGLGFTPASTCPEFCAFVVIPGSSVTPPPDTTSPVISGVTSSNITQTDATISWTTDEAADTQVEYGTTTSYGTSTTLNATFATSHSVALSGLNANTLYHYRVKSRDVASNLATSGDFTFTTLPLSVVSTPTISPNGGTFSSAQNVTLATTNSGASIRYTTNGTNPTSATGTIYSSQFSVSSTSTVKAIAYKTGSTDSSVASASFTINVPPPGDITPPVISGVTSSNIKFKSATITWSTNEVSNTQVEYGTTTSYGSATSINTNLVTSHTSNLGNLNPGTLYHYRVKSRDAAGNLATSGDFTFTTEGRLPKPPAPASVSFSPGSVILNWTSLDYELCASINIYRDTSSAPLTPDATKLIVSLNCTDTTYRDTNVTSGTTYYYSIFVFDDLGVSSDPLSGSFKAPAVSSGGGGGGSSGGGGTSSNTKIATNTTIPGCTGSTLFSPITGQACGTNTSVKPTSRYYNFGPVTLQNGSRGEGVKELQRYLNDTLNLGLVVDGILGPKTIAVIKTWQRNHALVADGLVGRKTKAMMNGLPIPN